MRGAAATNAAVLGGADRRAPPSDPKQWAASASTFTSATLLAVDTLSMVIATIIVLLMRSAIFGPVANPHFSLWASMLVWFGVRWIAGLYAPYGLQPPDKLRRSFISSIAALVTHFVILVALTQMEPWRMINLLVWLIVLPLTYSLRGLARGWLVAIGRYGLPIVVIGNGVPARRAIRELHAHPDLGFVPVGVFSTEYAAPDERQSLAGVPVIGRAEQAPTYSFPYPVRTALIVVGDGWHDERNHQLAEQLAARFPNLQIFSSIVGRSHWLARARPLGPYLIIETCHGRFCLWQRFLKRLLDIAVTLPALLLALPFMLLAGLAIVIANPGPMFFSQLREGRHGKPIRIYKLRSMVIGAEAKLANYLAENPQARFEYERTMKLRDDPRIIPKVGAFVRKTSLDEIPQLWSILKGDMSLVGPRVMPTREIELYSEEGKELRREVSPGLTGFWQVEHRSDSDFKIREIADSFYVGNWSIWLDIWIILRTVKVVASGSGAY